MKAWLVAGVLAFGALDAHSFWRTDIRAVNADGASGAVVNEESCGTRLEKLPVFTVCSDPGRVDIRPEHEATLHRVLELLQACPSAVALIQGHGDRGAVLEYNLALLGWREDYVHSHLQAGGIHAERLIEVSNSEGQFTVIETPEERKRYLRGTRIWVKGGLRYLR